MKSIKPVMHYHTTCMIVYLCTTYRLQRLHIILLYVVVIYVVLQTLSEMHQLLESANLVWDHYCNSRVSGG